MKHDTDAKAHQETGVVKDWTGTSLAIGHVICGIAAGLDPDENRGGSGMDSRYAITIAGDLGQSAVSVYRGRLSRGPVPAGQTPQYIHADALLTDASHAELVGDIDGMLLGGSAPAGKKLSEILHGYYCTRGAGGARCRFHHFQDVVMADRPRLVAQSEQFAQLFSAFEDHRYAQAARLVVEQLPWVERRHQEPILNGHVDQAVSHFEAWLSQKVSGESPP